MAPTPPAYQVRIDPVHGFAVCDPGPERKIIERFRMRSDAQRFVAQLQDAWRKGYEAGRARS